MRISLQAEGSSYSTDIETNENVTITHAYAGPIFRTQDGACLAVFMRDDGFEMNCWQGSAEHSAVLPSGAVMFAVSPLRGVTLLNESEADDIERIQEFLKARETSSNLDPEIVDQRSEHPDPDSIPNIYLEGRTIMLKAAGGEWVNVHPGKPPQGPEYIRACE